MRRGSIVLPHLAFWISLFPGQYLSGWIANWTGGGRLVWFADLAAWLLPVPVAFLMSIISQQNWKSHVSFNVTMASYTALATFAFEFAPSYFVAKWAGLWWVVVLVWGVLSASTALKAANQDSAYPVWASWLGPKHDPSESGGLPD